MSSSIKKRVKTIESQTSKKDGGIHSYEDHLRARLRGEKVDWDSTPYLRHKRKRLQQKFRERQDRIARENAQSCAQ